VVAKSRIVKIPNAFTGRLLDSIGIFDCKQQRLMYILQNQNDCPRLDHLQLNCNLYRIEKRNTRHTTTRIFLKKELLYIFANKILI
jgi:hypothetical protein